MVNSATWWHVFALLPTVAFILKMKCIQFSSLLLFFSSFLQHWCSGHKFSNGKNVWKKKQIKMTHLRQQKTVNIVSNRAFIIITHDNKWSTSILKTRKMLSNWFSNQIQIVKFFIIIFAVHHFFHRNESIYWFKYIYEISNGTSHKSERKSDTQKTVISQILVQNTRFPYGTDKRQIMNVIRIEYKHFEWLSKRSNKWATVLVFDSKCVQVSKYPTNFKS